MRLADWNKLKNRSDEESEFLYKKKRHIEIKLDLTSRFFFGSISS